MILATNLINVGNKLPTLQTREDSWYRLGNMSKLIVYYAHPGHKHSHVNKHMARAAARIDGITFVDLYADYPRFDIDVNVEQQRLLDHDVILFQFPLFWYSTPSIVKEWQDLVLEHGFAYGKESTKDTKA